MSGRSPRALRNIGVRFLLDVNVLVGLAFPQHTSHQVVHSWFRREPDRLWATCALTQAGFLRAASRALGGSRDAVRKALAGLEQDCKSPNHEYWSVDADLRDLSDSQRSRLIGPNQVADMLLILMAHRRRGQLATFDKGLGELASGTRYANSVLVL
jgi:toxin-antitoxin system PIN domain toxin